MISLDTNVLVRVVTADDTDQVAVALDTMKAEELWVCKTVLARPSPGAGRRWRIARLRALSAVPEIELLAGKR